MKTRRIFALLIIVSIIIFAMCKKDDVGPLSAEEAQVALNSADNEFNSVQNEVFTSPGMIAQETIYDLGLPFGTPMKSAKINFNQLNPIKVSEQFTESKGGYGPDYIYFNFTEYIGTWEKIDGVWQKVSPAQTDKIVIKFSYNGGTNNGTLTYYDYATQPIPYPLKVESTYISQLKAKIDIVGQTNPVMTMVYTANRTITGGEIKKVYTYGTAFTITEELAVYTPAQGKLTVDFLFEVKKNNDVVFSKSFGITIEGLSTNKVENFTFNATATVQIMDIIIEYTIFINQDTNTENLGNFLTVTLKLTNGAKVAEVVFEGLNNDAYFKFEDGTKKKVSELLSENLYEELGDFMDNIMEYFFRN